jgi:Zn-finger nucleic acid-binding protein
MIALEKNEDVGPICPHCKKELTKVWFQELKRDLGKRCLYFCPNCRACLGVSHRKGLAMGL